MRFKDGDRVLIANRFKVYECFVKSMISHDSTLYYIKYEDEDEYTLVTIRSILGYV